MEEKIMPRKDIPQNIPQDKLDDGNVADY